MKTSIQIISLLVLSLVFSCGENSSSNTSESELINRVNDVMQQMAIQGNINEEERLAILSLTSLVQNESDLGSYEDTKNAIPYKEVEVKPIYAGCATETTESCFEEKLAVFIENQFNKDLLKKTDVKGETTIEYFFKIDKTGNVSHRKIRESNVVILAELGRILKLIPKMKPGFQNEKPVDVMYAGTFTYGG